MRKPNRNEQLMTRFTQAWLFLLLLASTASGATYYLDADAGSDTTGDGSAGNPWATLVKAQATVVSGDTVKLYGGSYGAFSQTNPHYTSYVTYEAVDGDGDPPVFTSAIVNRTSTLDDVYLRFRDIWFDNGGLIVYRARYMEVEDCNFVGAGYTLADIPAADATNYAIRLEHDCTLITIRGCTITGDGAGQATNTAGGQDGSNFTKGYVWGIWAGLLSDGHITVEDCLVESCDYGISLSYSNLTISNNTVRYITGDGIKVMASGDTIHIADNEVYALGRYSDFHCDGIQFHGTVGVVYQNYTNVTIARNKVHTSDYQGIFCRIGPTSSNWLVENNLIYDIPTYTNPSYGFRFSNANPIVFRNNTIMSHMTLGNEWGGICHATLYGNILDYADLYTDTGVVVDNEDYNVVGTWWVHTYSHVSGAHTVEITRAEIPNEFNNYAARDFTLASDAYAVDRVSLGVDAAADINGNARVDVPGVGNDGTDYADAGAYEYDSSSPPDEPNEPPVTVTPRLFILEGA